MGKPLKNSSNSIGRELVTQYCNYSLQFEACGWDILTKEVTIVECLDVFLECIPRLLITTIICFMMNRSIVMEPR